MQVFLSHFSVSSDLYFVLKKKKEKERILFEFNLELGEDVHADSWRDQDAKSE